MSNERREPACGNADCAISTGVHDGLTFGRGDIDFNGFWCVPCATCARDYEARHPGCEPCWPLPDDVGLALAALDKLTKGGA